MHCRLHLREERADANGHRPTETALEGGPAAPKQGVIARTAYPWQGNRGVERPRRRIGRLDTSLRAADASSL
jgi:hypothetical protein